MHMICSWGSRVARLTALPGLLAASLAGCTPGANLPTLSAYDPHDYRLGQDDQIRVITYGEAQLSANFRVNDHGTVAVPLLGDLQAAGLTTTDFAAEMMSVLREKKLLLHPSVSVEIAAYRPIAILGEVSKPGQYPYQPTMTMLTAVAAAGGFTYRAVEMYAYVVRQEGDRAVVGRLLPQSYVKPGDVIKVYERHF